MNGPSLFERKIDSDGRLRLPDYLFDEYQTCYISLGLFSRNYLQITPDGVYLLIDQEITGDFKDVDAFRLQRNFHTGENLQMDNVGRIQIPLRLLERAQIPVESWVIGQAGISHQGYKPNGDGYHPAYWTLQSKEQYLAENPAGHYALDVTNARY